jgi:oligogalacturonide lyase
MAMKDWLDPITGRRILLLSDRPGINRSFYFHNNPFIPPAGPGQNDKMVFLGHAPSGHQYFTIDLKTFAIEQITDHDQTAENAPRVGGELVARKRREVIYRLGSSILATNIDTKKMRTIGQIDREFEAISTMNSDETIIVGKRTVGKEPIVTPGSGIESRLELIFRAKLQRHLFTMNADTGQKKEFYSERAWLNHLQCSPTDPTLLMFCHEGPWHMLDRIWNIRLDGTGLKLIHKRTVDREIAGHEFWSRDGRTIWFDLQIPRGETFWLTGYSLDSKEETRYQHDRNEWSVHYNISPDQKMFAGDGGGPNMVAKAPDGKWIYLFEPAGDRLKATKLVSMKDHDYALEPNVHFSPDQKYVIFRSNMNGDCQIYAVEL